MPKGVSSLCWPPSLLGVFLFGFAPADAFALLAPLELAGLVDLVSLEFGAVAGHARTCATRLMASRLL